MLLDIESPKKSFDVVHPETGITFSLFPISPRKYQALQKKSMVKGELNTVAFAANVAEYAIDGWGKEGDAARVKQECTEANKLAFGEKFAFNVMVWITNEAMSLDRSIQEELVDAKND